MIVCFLVEAYVMGMYFLVLGDEVEVEPTHRCEAFCDRKMMMVATKFVLGFVDRKFRVEMTDRRSE